LSNVDTSPLQRMVEGNFSWIEHSRMINKHKERLPKSNEALICAWR
jgi:hypothetical protein